MTETNGLRRAAGALTTVLALVTLNLALAGTLVLGPRAAAAQDATSLAGTFVWDSSASDNVAEAIDSALADRSYMHRQFARGHLGGANRPYRTVAIDQDADSITITMDGGEPITAPASGEPIVWTREDGERVRVSITRDEGQIRQRLTADDEVRENLFRPTANGRGITITVTIRMERLLDPIRYDLVYRRDEADSQSRPRRPAAPAPAYQGDENSRIRQYLLGLAGVSPLAGTFAVAGVDQLLNVPEEWDLNVGGYGRRVASRWGRFAMQTTVTHGLAAALDRPTQYLPCECSGLGRRVQHALLGTIRDPSPEGGRELAVPRLAGVYAGALGELVWTPGNADAGDALISGTSWVLVSAVGNLVQEFLGAKIPLLGVEIPLRGPGIFGH